MSSLSSDLYGLQLDAKTADALSRFAKRRRSLLMLRAIAAGMVFLLATMMLVALSDYLWLLSDGVRWLLSLSGYAITFAAMWWWGLRDLRVDDPCRLARQLETTDPRLREDLLSAVELADPASANGSEGFRAWLQRRVSRRAAVLDVRRLLPVGLVRRWLSTGLAIAVVFVLLLLVPKMQFGRRIARALLPGVPIQRASLTEVTILQPSPPSGYVAEGDAVGVVVRVNGVGVDDVVMQWRTDEGVDGETLMSPRVEQASAADQGTLAYGDVYAANVSVGSAPVEYRVMAGDAITLWHELTPLPRPRAESFQKRYQFPTYAKLSDRLEEAEHGDLKALVGTMAEVTIRFNQPVENATLRFGNRGVTVQLEPANEGDREFVANIPIKTPAQYQVDAVSTQSGLNNPFSPQYSITPVIDTPPLIQWLPAIPKTLIVSPLDVVSLGASVLDDLPIERVEQEFQINIDPVIRRKIDVSESARELNLSWDWDLLRRIDGKQPSIKLSGGDIIRTRVVAIDRRGNRGESGFIELLIAEEGFDADRHSRLHELGALTSQLADWLSQATQLLTPLKQVADVPNDQWETAVAAASELRQQQGPIADHIQRVVETAPTLPDAAVLELQGRALLDFDQKLGDWFARVEHVRGENDESWTKTRAKLLRDLGNESVRLTREASRITQYAQSVFGEELTVGIVSDAMALHRSLRPLLDEEKVLPPGRFPRYLTVAIGRMEAIDQLIAKHDAALPESTRRHLERWQRWSDTWAARLSESVKQPPSAEAHRKLVSQYAIELQNQCNHSMIDGRLASTVSNLLREIRVQLGATSDRVRQMSSHAENANKSRARAVSEDDSTNAAALTRDAVYAESQFARLRELLLARLAGEEALHRSRPSLDLQYAADMNLMHRAVENVTQDGYQPYREEPAANVHKQLAVAFQTIEAKHEADMWLRELRALMIAERKLDETAISKIKHPTWIERFSNGLEWPARTLRNVGIEPQLVQAVDQARYSPDLSQARQRITARRWNGEEMLTAETQLDVLQQYLSEALDALVPFVDEARATIQKYVLTLPEQAREAAQKAREAQARTESRPDSQQETAERLDQQQQEAEQATRETMEALVDLANTSDITNADQRELARDADAAAVQIQDALERAQQSMDAARQAANEQAGSDSLDQTAQALEDLSAALEQTAEHFERAENGEDLGETREQLRQMQAALERQQELESRFDRAEAMANAAEQTPQELLEQLERELQRNEPMQQELSEISERAAETARRALEQAAKDETALAQSLERSDATFQERKLRASRQISNLARRAAALDDSLLNAAERAVGWANENEIRPQLNEARQEIREAVQQANELGGENALLSKMQQTASDMAEAIETASEAIQNVQEQSAQAEDKDIHKDVPSRRRAKDQLERFQRDARTKQVRALNNEKNQWAGAERDAGRRIQQAQRQKRDAEKGKGQIEDRIKREDQPSESLQQQLAQMQQRLSDAQRAEQAAKETKEFADQQGKQADQRTRELQKKKLEPLDKPNPAAQLAAEMAAQAHAELDRIGDDLKELASAAKFADQLRSPAPQARSLSQQQQRIEQDVNDAAQQLHRAARHEERLGQSELAQQLEAAANEVEEKAATAAAQAADSLQQASDQAQQSPEANRRVAEAAEAISEAARQLGALLAAASPQPGEALASQPAEPSPAQERAEQLAQTLDELDRAIAQSQQQSQQQSPQPGKGQSEQPQGEESAQQQGQPSQQQSAGEASPTLANAMDAQAQQAARQRQQQMNPISQGQSQQQGQPSDTASNSTPASQPGMGQMPDGGFLPMTDVDRLGSDWGQLRERRTDDAAESRSATISPQYRREIQAYFRAIAKRAAERKD